MLEEILNRSQKAFSVLFAKDAELFRKQIHEQTVTFRFGIYLQEEFSNMSYQVDCEYNRQWDNPKRLLSTKRLIKPDLVVHRRLKLGEPNINANLFVLEAKKAGSWQRTFKRLGTRLCEMTDGGRFSYKLG